jgi:hypothetical protein
VQFGWAIWDPAYDKTLHTATVDENINTEQCAYYSRIMKSHNGNKALAIYLCLDTSHGFPILILHVSSVEISTITKTSVSEVTWHPLAFCLNYKKHLEENISLRFNFLESSYMKPMPYSLRSNLLSWSKVALLSHTLKMVPTRDALEQFVHFSFFPLTC